MDTANETKTRRPRRSKADIEAAIMRAAVAQIKKKGFSMALVTDIVKRANIEPIVFYNRYKNLGEFYDSFVKRYDSWMSDLVREVADSVMTGPGYDVALEKLLDKLMGDSIVIELLRWEVAEGTPITERTSRLRERDCMALINRYKGSLPSEDVDVVAISALVVAGVYFMVLHKDRSAFGGIDLNKPEGRRRITKAFGQLSQLMFGRNTDDAGQDAGKEPCNVDALRRTLRAEGLSDDAVERCVMALSEPC